MLRRCTRGLAWAHCLGRWHTSCNTHDSEAALQKPLPPEGHKPDENGLYAQSVGQRATRPHRYINPQPERILDAPEMSEDFYVNVLDWGPKNQVRALSPLHAVCSHWSQHISQALGRLPLAWQLRVSFSLTNHIRRHER